MAVLPCLHSFKNAGNSHRMLGRPLHVAQAGRGEGVLRAAPDRGCTVATSLPPQSDSVPRGFSKAQHAKLHLAGPHTDVRPERAEFRSEWLQHGLLYNSCRCRNWSRGDRNGHSCRCLSLQLAVRLGASVHLLDAAVPCCVHGGRRRQLLPGPVVHSHRAELQPKLHALLPLGAAAAAPHPAAGGLGLVLELPPLSLLAARGAEELEEPRAVPRRLAASGAAPPAGECTSGGLGPALGAYRPWLGLQVVDPRDCRHHRPSERRCTLLLARRWGDRSCC